jgi:hypothetical protein
MGDAMLLASSVLTTNFKTSKQFGFQPLMVPDFIVPLLTQWVKVIRPAILNLIPSAKHREQLASPHAPLWINLQGRVPKISCFVSKFFRKELNIMISPNKIRSLISTESQDLLDRGLITAAHKQSIENVSGHSSSITDAYYLKRSRTADAKRSQEAFSLLTSDGAQELMGPY